MEDRVDLAALGDKVIECIRVIATGVDDMNNTDVGVVDRRVYYMRTLAEEIRRNSSEVSLVLYRRALDYQSHVLLQFSSMNDE